VNFRRQNTPELTVNLTPLIDVVFLLLIFFMVSTTFSKESQLSLNLPEASGEPRVAEQQQIEIVIDGNGQYAINGRALVSSSLETVKKALADISGSDVKQLLIISADAQTPHQAVITAMDAAAQMGFSQLSLSTKTPASER
jgi:biopolymer transport protein ExbD